MIKATLVECQPGAIFRRKEIKESDDAHACMTASAWCRLTEHDEERPLGTMMLVFETGEIRWRNVIGPDHISWEVPEMGSEMPWDWLGAALGDRDHSAIKRLEAQKEDLRAALKDLQEEIEGLQHDLDGKEATHDVPNTVEIMREIEQTIESYLGSIEADVDMDDEIKHLEKLDERIDEVLARTE